MLEESKLPIRKWLAVFHLMTSSKKGVSSRQIARELGCCPKTAWFTTMRIREAMRSSSTITLKDAVECDECYIGGKPRYSKTTKRGRGTEKTPIVALVERDGNIHSRPVDHVDAKTLHSEAKKYIDKNATVFTDEFASYLGIGSHFAGHRVVKHSAKEYSRTDSDGVKVTTNSVESYFALLKRGHFGTSI